MFKDENIITDRHFLSNYAWSGTDDNTEVYDLLVKKLGFPDLTVILYADETAIFNRLRSRDEHDSDLDKVKKAKEKYEKMVFFCKKYKMPYMVVDTSNLTPDQTVELLRCSLFHCLTAEAFCLKRGIGYRSIMFLGFRALKNCSLLISQAFSCI